MPSNELTTAPGLLDLDVESDQRDWFSEFREESAIRKQSLGRHPKTLFTVVQHGRPAPIVIPEVPEAVQPDQSPAHRRRSLYRRFRRALSPALTALILLYLAVIFVTGYIGVRRSETARTGDQTIQSSTPEPTEASTSANDIP